MPGICGNWNGDAKDDLMTAEGKDVTGDRNKYTLIGNSWQVSVDDQEEERWT